jgi:uncharacterized protein YqgV (UPF0045/DUF77 family)
VKVEVQAILFPYDGSRTVAVTKLFVNTLEGAGIRCVVGNMATSCYGEMETVLSTISAAYQAITVTDKISISLVVTNDMPLIGRKP